MKNSVWRYGIMLSLGLWLCLSATIISPSVIAAQTPPPPIPTPTPIIGPHQPGAQPLLALDLNPTPLVILDQVEIRLSITGRRGNAAHCYGIPYYPLDVFILVDNSASAGSGDAGSNLERTRQILQGFVTQADQSVFLDLPLPRVALQNRIGLISTSVMVTGTVVTWKPLESDYGQIRENIAALGVGGDTELASGIQLAMQQWRDHSRKEARRVLLLMLHDRAPIEFESSLAALQEARNAGIDIYLFSNSLNLTADQSIDANIAARVVDKANFFADPTPEQLRRAFVQMTQGDTISVARALSVLVQWLPPGFEVANAPLGVEDNQILWWIPQLADNDRQDLTYKARLTDSLVGTEKLQALVTLSYLDCNGLLQTQISHFSFALQMPTPTPTPLPTLPRPTTPTPVTPISTIVPTPVVPVPTIAPMPAVQSEDILEWLNKLLEWLIDHFWETGPIERLVQTSPDSSGFFVWLVQHIPALATVLTWLATTLPAIAQWLLIILFVLLFLFLLWRLFNMLKKLWGHKRPADGPKSPGPPTPPLPPSPPTPTLPRWIPALSQNVLLAADGDGVQKVPTTTPHPLQDTLLIGLGPAGREVLSQMAVALTDRFGNKWPSNVHFLQVDVQPQETAGQMTPPTNLRSDQWVLLRPDLQTVAKTLREKGKDYPHWQWYEATAPDYARARGRMAVFYDLQNQTQNSVLWKAIERGLQGLNTPVIRVIGTTFDDVSSGMLVDVVRLTQLVAAGHAAGNVEVQLWLAGPVGRDWSDRLGTRGRVRADEQITRTLATLRELERFQRNARRKYEYVQEANRQDILRAVYDFSVIGKVVVFEPLSGTPQMPENDTLTCIADSLLALLDSGANRQWNALLTDETSSRMGGLANREGQGAVLAIGCYALRKPRVAVLDAMAWRMVRDALFETALGLHPLEKLTAAGDYQLLPDPEQGQPLKSAPMFSPTETETLVERHKGYWDAPAFDAAVRTRLNELLNGEQDGAGDAAVTRRAGLAQAVRWLETLEGQLRQQEANEPAQRIRNLIKQLTHWQTWLKDEVYPLCDQFFKAARAELQRLQSQPARGWGLTPELEWPYYRDYIRKWDTAPMGTTQDEPLLRLAARFGWEVEITSQGWRARLLVPPGEFDERLDVRHLDRLRPYEITPNTKPTEFLQALYALAVRAARVDAQTTAADLALRQDMTGWLERARPRLRYNEAEANRQILAVNELTLLVTPESAEHTPRLREQLTNAPGIAGRLEVCQTDDPTTVTLLKATSWLPLSAVDLYSSETWQSYPVPPNLYVWRAEQIAAELETDDRLSAVLVDRIAQNESLLRAFGLSVIYEVIRREEARGWQIPGLEQPAESLSLALDRLFDGDEKTQATCCKTLQDKLDKRVPEITQRLVYLKRAEDERVRPLLTSADPRERDLGCYLRGLLIAERNG